MAKSFIDRIKDCPGVESVDNGLPSGSLFVNLKPRFAFAYGGHSSGFDQVSDAYRAARHLVKCDCERCVELAPLTKLDDPRHFLGKGFETTPGKPFGYAHMMERQALREHVRKRGRHVTEGITGAYDPRVEHRIARMQERIHRHKPTLRETQAAWRARCAAAQPRPEGERTYLTWEELQHLVDLFTGANDPLSLSIAEKAAEALAKREE